jgi:hypothetical protein
VVCLTACLSRTASACCSPLVAGVLTFLNAVVSAVAHGQVTVAVGEVPVALHRQLMLVVERAHPRPADRDAPTPERH